MAAGALQPWDSTRNRRLRLRLHLLSPPRLRQTATGVFAFGKCEVPDAFAGLRRLSPKGTATGYDPSPSCDAYDCGATARPTVSQSKLRRLQARSRPNWDAYCRNARRSPRGCAQLGASGSQLQPVCRLGRSRRNWMSTEVAVGGCRVRGRQ